MPKSFSEQVNNFSGVLRSRKHVNAVSQLANKISHHSYQADPNTIIVPINGPNGFAQVAQFIRMNLVRMTGSVVFMLRNMGHNVVVHNDRLIVSVNPQ